MRWELFSTSSVTLSYRMSPEQLKQNAAAMIAYAEGKPVEVRLDSSGNNWTLTDTPTFDCSAYDYRPKPEPKTVPWSKPEHVPGPVCWIRGDGIIGMMIVGFCAMEYGVVSGNGLPFSWEDISRRSLEYSTDCINWSKCEVVEEP